MHISGVLYRVESVISSFHQARCILHHSMVLVFVFWSQTPISQEQMQ